MTKANSILATLIEAPHAGNEQRSLLLARPEAVIIRQSSADGRFVRTVKCLPGSITVLAADHPALIQPFRNALLGTDQNEPVTVRTGSRILHPSEVYAVENGYVLWSKGTLADVVRGAGAAAGKERELLELAGLDYALEMPPAELPPGALRRLLILTSFFARSRVLYFDRPFLGVEERWAGALAALLADGIEHCANIAVVTGVKPIPREWLDDKRVHIERIDFELPESFARSEKEIRDLFTLNVDSANPPSFVTRPQLIHRKRRTVEVMLQAEVIHNPNIDTFAPETSRSRTEAGAINESAEIPAARRDGSMVRRSPSGKLTKVTGIKRMKHSSVGMALREWRERLDALFKPDAALAAMPKEAQLAEGRRRVELRLFLYIIIGLALILLAIKFRH